MVSTTVVELAFTSLVTRSVVGILADLVGRATRAKDEVQPAARS